MVLEWFLNPMQMSPLFKDHIHIFLLIWLIKPLGTASVPVHTTNFELFRGPKINWFGKLIPCSKPYSTGLQRRDGEEL